jgi:hypothetical protein
MFNIENRERPSAMNYKGHIARKICRIFVGVFQRGEAPPLSPCSPV